MEKTLDIFNRIATEYLQAEKDKPVTEFVPTETLFEQLDLSLKTQPLDQEQFENIMRDLVLSSTKTASTGFFNQLYGGRNDKAVLGDLLAVLLNNSMYTYKAAGVQIGVEKITLRESCKMIGWDDQSDGTFASGGSLTNFMSMIMARDAANKDIKHDGVTEKLTVYTSIESHYSIPKNAAFSGIGRKNVRYIPTDSFGKLNVEALESQILEDIANGFKPCLVNLTAGTTVLGAFDPIEPVAVICKKYDIWLHVDGAYCGSVIFSSKYKHLIKGVELADSFSYNAHKMIGTPLTCSLILVKDKRHLHGSFSNDADYLFQTDGDDFNLGKTSLQCGRRNDALKFWTLWKSVGTEGLEQIVDHQFELADTARDYVRNHPDYTLYSFDDSISVCFSYKGMDSKQLCKSLYENAQLLVSHGEFQSQDFVRFVTINGQNKKEDILNFFHKLETHVAKSSSQLSQAEA